MPELGSPIIAPTEDIGLLCEVVSSATSDRIVQELVAAGFDDLRPSHGYVFQGLVAGDTTITQLAQRLGVSAQAVSKTVTELERLGYVERRRDERDGRARSIALTHRATKMLQRSRRARATVQAEIVDALGVRDARKLAALLRSVCDLSDGLDVIAGHRLRPRDDLA
jgi:DNA-binding MarR family transcriptional regulator